MTNTATVALFLCVALSIPEMRVMVEGLPIPRREVFAAVADASIAVRYHGEQSKPFPFVILARKGESDNESIRMLRGTEAVNTRMLLLDNDVFAAIWQLTADRLSGVAPRVDAPEWIEAYEIISQASATDRYFLPREAFFGLLNDWSQRISAAEPALAETLDPLIQRLSN